MTEAAKCPMCAAMTDYTKPLADPVLEAVARLAWIHSENKLSDSRRLAFCYPTAAREAFAKTLRLIDCLRAAAVEIANGE